VTDQLDVLRAALQGRYEIERELGRGGMGAVFLARDVKHERLVAIKTLRPELSSAIATERFLKEIRFTARLTHPHIVPIHDSGEADGTLYYVMPFVEGESLRNRLIRDGRLPVADALRIAHDVADALQHAHQHDVLHRDIKPENILLESGHAVVADFGIARAVSSAGTDTLTQTGQLVGTPLYMSPEQAQGAGEIDGRSDIYSLGCVLYEMLVGAAPHAAPTPQGVLARVLTEPAPPVRAARPDVPAEVERLVATALAKERDDRFGTAGDLAAALDAGRVLHRRVARPRLVVAVSGLILLLGVSAVAIWRYSHRPAAGSEMRLVAVLPFENLGDSADAYFADGMTEAVRGKLSAIPGLQVTARSSSSQYRATTKTPQQIGQELGVQYLLTGTIRWQRASDVSRVQVTPELVRVVSASTQWEEPFDAPYTDVFTVQAEIAGRVARTLNVVLSDSIRQHLAEKPTSSLAAYDAYLKGEEVSHGLASGDPATLRQAVAYYAQAVALDSTFVQAWDKLSRAHSGLYTNSTPTAAEAELARRGAERALALAPSQAEGRFASGVYNFYVSHDIARAARELQQGRQAAPGNADLLAMAGQVEASLGHWDSAVVFLQRSQALDPRSILPPSNLAQVLVWLRRYPEARTAVDHALVLAPTHLFAIENRTMVSLGQGDLAGARAVVAAAPNEVDPAALVIFFAFSWDLYWVLDEAQQQLLLRLTPNAFDGDRGNWGIVLAQTYWLRGEQARARVYADSARLAYQRQLQGTPEDAQRHVLLGLALAYLGRKADAVREGQRGLALSPIAENSLFGPYYQHQLARIYILVDEPEKALDQLEPLLRIPYYLSPGWLRIDPTFDPLRQNPRFQRLFAGN
jgi:serine/threonine-protein kinase